MDTPNYGHWIKQAEMCRRTAANATDDVLRTRFLRFAKRYDALAAASVPDTERKSASITKDVLLFFAEPVEDPVSDLLIATRTV